MTVGGCHGGGTIFFWIRFCSVGTLQLDFVVDPLGFSAASVIEEYVCAVLVDLAVKSQSDSLGASIEMDCPILGLCVLCIFFSVVGSKQTWQRKFSSDFSRALRKCVFLQIATARYYLNWKLLWRNISIERGTLQIHYQILLGQIWVNFLGRLLFRILNHHKVLWPGPCLNLKTYMI